MIAKILFENDIPSGCFVILILLWPWVNSLVPKTRGHRILEEVFSKMIYV